MVKLATPSQVKKTMAQYGFHCRKSLGQNFLIDSNIVDKILQAASLHEEDFVLEIGPGLGVLTQELAAIAHKVVAVEKDNHLLPILQETLQEFKNIEIIQGDALQEDFDTLMFGHNKQKKEHESYKIVANLPYYITTPLLIHLMNQEFHWQTTVIMVQQEVAERLSASPGTKAYGSLTVAVRYYAHVEYLFSVPHTVFFPQPEVDSAVIRLTKRTNPIVQVSNEKLYFQVVRSAFGQRRKTLLNALHNAFSWVPKNNVVAVSYTHLQQLAYRKNQGLLQ